MSKKVRNNREFKRFRKGAASFYIVAISTLILVIIAASFAAVIISEVTRTSNDDLSQSAYDSALAGVEDAKLAFYQYQQCKNGETGTPGSMTCDKLIDAIEHPDNYESEENCDMVAKALGRDIENNNVGKPMGVMVREGNNSENSMQQYYTCVKISAQTDDYLGELDSDDPEHSVRLRFKKDNGQDDTAAANDVKSIRLSWHSFNSSDSGSKGARFNWMEQANGSIFGKEKVTPAVVSLTVLQTDNPFDLSEFDMTSAAGGTDRGTLYFVPNDLEGKGSVAGSQGENYIGVGYNGKIDAGKGLAKSNDKTIKNLPYWVDCQNETSHTEDYACSVVVDIPPTFRGESRNPETFIVSVALPYGEPKTDYRLEFLKADGTTKPLDGVQISIDSTGRANDLFRRVDTRLEPADASYPYPIYGIEALDPGANPGIEKDFDTTCEYNFDDVTCP